MTMVVPVVLLNFSYWILLLLFVSSTSSFITTINAFNPSSTLPSHSTKKLSISISSSTSCLSKNNNNRVVVGGTSTALRSSNMMFDQLSSALSNIVSQLGPKQRLTEQNIQPALKSVRRALLEADVNINVADTLMDGVRTRTVGQQLVKGVTAEQQFVKAMYDELLDIMGGSSTDGNPVGGSLPPVATLAVGTLDKPAIILLAGLQGAGKTTVAGKLALYLKEREANYDTLPDNNNNSNTNSNNPADNLVLASRLPKRERKVLLIAADIYRPAAIKQLQVLGSRVGVEVFTILDNKDAVDIVTQGIEYAIGKFDTIIVDTAGRQVIDTNLMKELQRIKQVSNADETLLIVDAMTGQEAATLTSAFDNAVGITGAILTKMDGDVRGGAAVSVRGVSGQPIKFIGIGEKITDLEPFYPDRMASRILGMGDVVSLVEKAAAAVSDADAYQMQQKMRDASFDFDDFVKQSESVTQMGSVANIAKMMPGIGNQLNMNQIQEVEQRLKKNKAMIQSMTKKERANPDLLIVDKSARSRLIRITSGSGYTLPAGQQFMSEFQKMRTMMARMQKQMGGNNNMDPNSMADPSSLPSGDDMAGSMGNRAMRRQAKKSKKNTGTGKRGFG